MISERKLVSSHSSFWRHAMPLGDSFVRFMNSSLDRFHPPVEKDAKSNRNSLISELSFRIFEEYTSSGNNLFDIYNVDPKVLEFSNEVVKYISALDPNSEFEKMSVDEINIAKSWTKNLDKFRRFVCPGQKIMTRPHFEGCGIIDPCFGDILAGTTLWELKNVERDFRLADIRQLLTYCALNYSSQQHKIDSVGLVNARHGTYFTASLASLAVMSSAMTEGELLGEIVRYITADTPSR